MELDALIKRLSLRDADCEEAARMLVYFQRMTEQYAETLYALTGERDVLRTEVERLKETQ
jgi:hypothetical protein